MNTRTEKRDKEEIIELIKTLVQIPSYMTVEGGETRVAEKILEIALSEGLEGRLEEVTKGRSNVEIILKGQGEGKTILFLRAYGYSKYRWHGNRTFGRLYKRWKNMGSRDS